ncbi:hypothetical protein [Donghicola eburneus]|uniref:hypothetical protein n=1 Tax=Donghicola eburneus TaxID=393278 RepID=UPI0008EA0859|nr:hypothetical protein [Donghicola eburneus]SFQ66288.1 hypothetical protein SAMN05421764_1098 [Donghicola eburneus]
MNEKDRWELRFEFVKSALTGLGLILSVLIFVIGDMWTAERENELAEARNLAEYERRLWDERRDAYRALAEVLGGIAADLDSGSDIDAANKRAFDKTYWGALILTENEEIELQMVRLRNDLRDLEAGRTTSDQIKRRVQRIVSLSREHLEEVSQ